MQKNKDEKKMEFLDTYEKYKENEKMDKLNKCATLLSCLYQFKKF